MAARTRRGRKLLVASLGVAAVSYVACGGNTESSTKVTKDAQADVNGFDVVANLVAPTDAQADVSKDVNVLDVVANLVAPPDASDAAKDQGSLFDVVANLVPPDGGT